jgi:hypothetical protein
MFEIGLKDTLTVKKPTSTGLSNGNVTQTWATIINAVKARKVASQRVETDQTGARILVKVEKVIVNYIGTDIDEKCIAFLNNVQYEITMVEPAEGFGRNHLSITIKARQ